MIPILILYVVYDTNLVCDIHPNRFGGGKQLQPSDDQSPPTPTFVLYWAIDKRDRENVKFLL